MLDVLPFRNNDVFWSDVNSDVIYRAELDGTGQLYVIANSYISAVGMAL